MTTASLTSELSTLSTELKGLQAERTARRTARKTLIPFTEYTFPGYETAEHQRVIAEHLDRVIAGDLDRLMILMPPRHGKSELASRRFPAFFVGQHPSKSIIAASYSSDLASDFGREVRNIVASREYERLFPGTRLAQDSQAANRWHTDAGGAYVAAGVGTAITGRGAHVLLIDDPVKDRQEADSEATRESVWKWYSSTAYTRLAPDGAIVLIQTRWHEDDLAGRLLHKASRGGDQWTVLELPAMHEGKALWPEWYNVERLERIRTAIDPRDWSALFQQRPSPESGHYFKREWFRWYDEIPKHLRVYGASDYAVTDKGGDYTVHLVVGIDPEDNIHILDLWREQTESDVWIEAFLDLVVKWKPLYWAEERGQIIKSVGPFIEKRMRERKVYCARESFTSAVDKPTRGQAIRARASMGKVYLPQQAPWLSSLMTELMTFPVGVNDDQVDTLSLIGRMLADMVGGVMPKKPGPEQDRWMRVFLQEDPDTWKTV